jgi:hypothetical protein
MAGAAKVNINAAAQALRKALVIKPAMSRPSKRAAHS